MPSAERQFTVLKKLKTFALLPVAGVLFLLVMILPGPKDTLLGTWQDNQDGSISQHRISIKFQSNGEEIQQLQTAHGLLIVRGHYVLETITLKHIFSSASLNGKPTKLPVSSLGAGYRCKVAENGLELDSHALAAEVPGEHFLPLDGQQILLLRVEGDK